MYNPKSIDDTFKMGGPFDEFETEYFPQIYESLGIKPHDSAVSSETDRLQVILDNNLDVLRYTPRVLDDIISANILSLAIRYQVYLAEHFCKGLSGNNDNENFFLTDYTVLASKLKNDTGRNATIAYKHLTNVKANFFSEYKDEELAVGTIKLDSSASIAYVFRTMTVPFREAMESKNYWSLPIKDIVKYKTTLGNNQFVPKFDMLTHPFVFAVNCAYLHKRLFVLSLNTDSDFSFILKTRKPRQVFSDLYKDATRILDEDISVEDYIVEFVNAFESTFQRDKENISQILFGVHMESIQQVKHMLHKRWIDYCFEAIKPNLNSAISDTQNYYKTLAEQSSITSFGWS